MSYEDATLAEIAEIEAFRRYQDNNGMFDSEPEYTSEERAYKVQKLQLLMSARIADLLYDVLELTQTQAILGRQD